MNDKKLPLFHPAIPGVISIIFAIVSGIIAAKWLDYLMNL